MKLHVATTAGRSSIHSHCVVAITRLWAEMQSSETIPTGVNEYGATNSVTKSSEMANNRSHDCLPRIILLHNRDHHLPRKQLGTGSVARNDSTRRSIRTQRRILSGSLDNPLDCAMLLCVRLQDCLVRVKWPRARTKAQPSNATSARASLRARNT